MSREKEYIKILQAALDGKVVQYRGDLTEWYTVQADHVWNFMQNEYKICIPRDFALDLETGVIWSYDTNTAYSANTVHVREVL